MSPQVREAFARILHEHVPRIVLEIGATPHANTLLYLPKIMKSDFRVGINLSGPHKFNDVFILKANAHALPFPDYSFDTVLCNSVIEHDPEFWLTIAEIKRVAAQKALIILGTPGFSKKKTTLPIHNYPGDYYRFSEQAMRKMLEDLYDLQIKEIMDPPRIIGWGLKV